MPVAIAIVGRPNVGKSTLFNRLVGRRLALVDDRPGLTRDRREGDGRLGDLVFRLFDTAGLDDASGGPFEDAMRRQTERAVADAHLVLLLIDSRAGLLPHDRALAQWLRRLGKPVIAVANKAERGTGGTAEDALALGFGEPVAISAEHGLGLAELYDALRPHLAAADGEGAAEAAERPLRLAIVGRPNVGKSTLLNRLLGEERQVTSELPGTTRDAIAVRWRFRERAVELVDTAGLRKTPKIVEAAEKLAAADARRAIGLADVVALVIDATQPLERQDLTVADLATEEGRALIVVANKWDRVDDPRRTLVAIGERLERSLPQVRGVAVVPISALSGRGIAKLMPAVVTVDAVWRRKVGTGALNRWLEDLLEHHPPPMAGGRSVKIRYMAQTGVRPPTFAVFVNRAGALADTYLRYLANGLREHFGLVGVPIRFQVRHGKNPFAPR